jgi:prolyl-tRNA synthetase
MSTSNDDVAVVSGVRRGDVALWSRVLIPTTRQAPADAETPSHVLLVRGGYIRRVGAGIYTYLPLAWRTLRKISDIVRQEMDRAGACELLMPALEPIELLSKTGRDEDYGDLLFRVTDRHGRVAALGPTHEEIITDLVSNSVNSYKQLPLNLYQIQTKFRDEFRPRSALLRGREFVMKDAYSFHMNVDGPGGLDETYDAMYAAYVRIFERCGFDFTVVEAESGPIGGSASHEFMVNAEMGEDTILRCPETGYAANVEKCETGPRPADLTGEPVGELTKVHTPDCPGIDDVSALLKVKPNRMLKTIVFKVLDADDSRRWVVAVVRGDHDVNEAKVRDASGCRIALADEAEAKAAGFAIGYVSPRVVNMIDGVLLLVDPDAAQPGFWATGADEPDHHVKYFNWRRELGDRLDDESYVKLADARNALAGDPSPKSEHARLVEQRGIEVGHIFKLGTKYSEAMGLAIMDENQTRQPVIMGCYGLGVSRSLQAAVEMAHDDDGIIWKPAIAPYHVLVTVMKPNQPEQMESAHRIASDLAEHGIDVLIDDRTERPGVKFKDADLVGIPIRLTIGDKALEAGGAEFKRRGEPGKGEVVVFENLASRCREALEV